MEASPQSIASKTTVLDLDDDCLREVFERMNIKDLTANADVCTRFRYNAAQAARSKFKYLYMHKCSSVGAYAKLRNFGASVTSVCVDSLYGQKGRAQFQKRIIELLNLYCVGETIDLKLSRFDIIDDLAVLMVPLLGRVQNLNLEDCQSGGLFLKKLPFWSPELRELNCQSLNDSDREGMQFDGLHRNFPKLESIVIVRVAAVNITDIEEILKWNPQLKRIQLVSCCQLDESILKTIAKHVPKIVKISLSTKSAKNSTNLEHLPQLSELKTLILSVDDNHSYVQSIVPEIALAATALEHLDLSNFNLRYKYQQFVEGISKLKTLKTLRLCYVENMRVTNLLDMCKPLKQLSEVHLFRTNISLWIERPQLLEFVKNAEKLQKLEIVGDQDIEDEVFVNVNTYMKLLSIVNQRKEKMKLDLTFGNKNYKFSAEIAEEFPRDAIPSQ